MGARRGWKRLVADFVRPIPGLKVLDIGCGPGDLLDYLPPGVEYWGFDISESYVKFAKEKFGCRGRFYCQLLSINDLSLMPKFDIVVASGVLHHMDDLVANEFVSLAHAALRQGGRLVTLDPCWSDDQSEIARFIISRDRGQNVRDARGYETLVESLFPNRMVTVRHRAWIPYTHCFMECVRE